ncbi:MAG: TIGR04086 family membrane protein [Clostridia bacterium]|nr:TIGR04086 family membrane protein [Clostridia bacterium]
MSNKKENSTGRKSLIKHSAVGAALGMLLTLAAILVFSALIVSGVLPATLRDAFILVSVIMGSTLSGLYCAGRESGGVVIAGLSSAAAYIMLILAVTLLFGKNSGETALTFRIIIATVAGASFGAVLKLHRKKKKSKLRR